MLHGNTKPSAASSADSASSMYVPPSNRPDSQNALQVPQAPSRQSSGMLMRCRYEASATVWSSRQLMNRVTPSSKASATL
jgi:hypothetical protein